MLSFFKSFFALANQPKQYKKPSLSPALSPIIPEYFYFPLCDERQQLLSTQLSVGQKIKKHQVIANTTENNAPLHAPLDGEVVDIRRSPNALMKGKNIQTLIVKPISNEIDSTRLSVDVDTSLPQLKELSVEEIDDLHGSVRKKWHCRHGWCWIFDCGEN